MSDFVLSAPGFRGYMGRIFICFLMFSAIYSPAGCAQEFAAGEGGWYRLGAGDTISIVVYGEPDLSYLNYRLPDSGLIAFPFGNVVASGLTITELVDRVTAGLRGGYLVNPRVSIGVSEYRPFFVNGQVGHPGGFPYQPGMTVRKAVSIAGGFKERAAPDKIFAIRESDPLHRQSKISLDDSIYPGDTITVEESFF